MSDSSVASAADPGTDGYFIDIMFGNQSTPPNPHMFPSVCVYRHIFAFCVQTHSQLCLPQPSHLSPMQEGATTDLTSSTALTSNTVRGPQMPTLSPQELHSWRMMGFPFNRQWRWAYDATTDHHLTKIPTPVHMFTDLHILRLV